MTTEPSTSHSSAADSLARQVRLYKTLAAILFFCLVAASGYWYYMRHLGQPVAILIDGKQIGVARNLTSANTLLTEAEQQKTGPEFGESDTVRLQSVQLKRVASNSVIDPDSDLRANLVKSLKLHVRAYVILVNGKPSLAFPTNALASETIRLVKDHFTALPPSGQIVGDVKMLTPVLIKRMSVDTDHLRTDPEKAAPYFWTPPPAKTYIVQPGDRGYKIALRNHISFTDFLAANSGRNLNKLTPGDEVNVQKMPLMLKVEVQKQFETDEKILAHAPDAEAGKRHVTYLATYLNGAEIRRDVLNMATLEKPRTRSSL